MASVVTQVPAASDEATRALSTGAVARTTSRQRIATLDFAKGVLVLVMVFYHWVNYFIGLAWPGYRFIRFLTPAFICITGYVISHVYLQRYSADHAHLRQRLVRRGLKLLALFVGLNVLAFFIAGRSTGIYWDSPAAFLAWLRSMLLEGRGRAAFDILVPIAYFLILTPAILWVTRWRPAALVTLAVIAVALVTVIEPINQHLEILSFALVGLAAGTPVARQWLAQVPWRWLLLPAYLAYLAAVAVWHARYPLQVVGVVLNLLAIHRLAIAVGASSALGRQVITLGEYSLLAYVAQIIALQLLRRGLPTELTGGAVSFLALILAVAATIAAVQLAAVLRARSVLCDRAYRAIFA